MLARGRTPTGALRIHTAGDSRNAKDAKYLREQMDRLRASMNALDQEEKTAFESCTIPEWHARALRAHQRAISASNALTEDEDPVSLECALASAKDFISYDELVEISHTDNLVATLGGKDQCDKSAFVRTSNRERVTFDYVYANLEKMLVHVIHETEMFALRPEQRLTVAMEFLRLAEETHCTTKEAQQTEHGQMEHFSISAGTRPSLSLMTLGTGNGKTIVTILSTVTAVCVPCLWAEMQCQWKKDVTSRTTMPNLGICQRRCIGEEELARVVIAFVPSQLINQWELTAKAVRSAMNDKNMGFEVWVGLSVFQRKGRGPNGQRGIRRTLSVAHARSQARNQPIFWIVPAKPESAMQTIRNAPHLSFAYRISDECSQASEPRLFAKESQPVRDIICQATVGRLASATESSPRHPLRKALGVSYSESNPAHASIFHLISVPNWLRLLMGRSMRALMPSGLRCLHLKIKIQSMSGRLLKSDLTVTCLDDLLKAVLRSTGELSQFTVEETAALINRCKSMISSSEATPIHTRLLAAASDAATAMAQLPDQIANPSLDDQIAYRPVHRKKRVNHAMNRLFEKLAESVNHKSPPICPISEDPIEPENVGIFFCCTTPYDTRYTSYIAGNNCPNCNSNLSGMMLKASHAIGALTSKPPSPPPPRSPFVGEENSLVEALKRSESSTFTSSIKAVISAIQDFLRFKPNGARILLAFACNEWASEGQGTSKTRRTLLDAVPALESVDSVHYKSNVAVTKFVTPSNENRVLLINTSHSSVSLEGLDLWNADVILLDKCNQGRALRTETIVQAIGRILRPQYKQYVPGQAETNVSHPAKYLVLLEPLQAAHDPIPELDEDDQVDRAFEHSDDEEDDEGEWEQFNPEDLQDVVP